MGLVKMDLIGSEKGVYLKWFPKKFKDSLVCVKIDIKRESHRRNKCLIEVRSIFAV